MLKEQIANTSFVPCAVTTKIHDIQNLASLKQELFVSVVTPLSQDLVKLPGKIVMMERSPQFNHAGVAK